MVEWTKLRQTRFGSLVWASHSSTVSLSLLNYKYSSTQKRTPGNQNLASPCDFSKEGLHTESFTLSFSLIIRVGVRWGWMQLLMKLEGQCLQIKLTNFSESGSDCVLQGSMYRARNNHRTSSKGPPCLTAGDTGDSGVN